MKSPPAAVPEDLHPLAREILEHLCAHPESVAITIGGGIALQHYLNLRSTVDLDAWWSADATSEVRRLIQEAVGQVAGRQGCSLRIRSWGETESHEILRGSRKIFAFQIARRDVHLDSPLPSAWPPVLLETFRDNLGSKMNALVQRGAPRDFVDVFHVCTHGLAVPDECWELWVRKNPELDAREGKAQVLERLSVIEARRPLQGIAEEKERQASARLRDWVKQAFCKEVFHEPGAGS